MNRWQLGTLDLKPRLPEILSSNDDGMRTWTAWAILAYDLDTLAIRSRRKLRHAHSTRATHKPDSAAPQPDAAVSVQAVYPGQVATSTTDTTKTPPTG